MKKEGGAFEIKCNEGYRQNGEAIKKHEGFEEEYLQDRNLEAPHSFFPNALNLFASYTVRQ
jgi:hypothetical protein